MDLGPRAFNVTTSGKGMVQEPNEFEQLDPNWIPAEHFSAAIFFSILSCASFVGWILFAFFVWGFSDARTWLILLATVAVLAVLIWWSRKYTYLQWQTTRLRKSELGLELHRGVYWQHKIFIPRERIQHTDITQGPVSRKFHVAELVINTAGNHNYVIKIEGLNFERAKELRLELLPRVRSKEIEQSQTIVAPDFVTHDATAKVESSRSPIHASNESTPESAPANTAAMVPQNGLTESPEPSNPSIQADNQSQADNQEDNIERVS